MLLLLLACPAAAQWAHSTARTECARQSCDLNAATTLGGQGMCLADGTDCPADADTTCLDAGVTCNFAGSATEGGPATTALALNADPSDCSANQFATTIAANGNLTCAAIATGDLPAGATLDTEWDTAAEINAATTDDDFVTETGNHTISGTKTVTGVLDVGGGTLEVPNGTTVPATCTPGRTFIDLDGGLGQTRYDCMTTDNWQPTANPYGITFDGSGFASTVELPAAAVFDTRTGVLKIPVNTGDPGAEGVISIDSAADTIEAHDGTDLLRFMNLSTAQTVAGDKTFSGTMSVTNVARSLTNNGGEQGTTLVYTDNHTSGLVSFTSMGVTLTTGASSPQALILSGLQSVAQSASSNGAIVVIGMKGTASKAGTGSISTAIGLSGSVSALAGTNSIQTGVGVQIADATASGGGVIDLLKGLEIQAQTKGTGGGPTTNVGLENGSTTVFPPTVQAVTGATYTILARRTLVTFTTVTGTTVMTSNPTIEDGRTGQVIILLNTDATGTDCITINDGTTGVQLSANTTLCPTDSLILLYNGTDWLQIPGNN